MQKYVLGSFIIFLAIFWGIGGYYGLKYNSTCCHAENRAVLHRFSGEYVVPPTIITSRIERNYLFGIRFPVSEWQCKSGRANSILRLSPNPVYFVLRKQRGAIFKFKKDQELLTEFSSRNEFESYLKGLGLTKYQSLRFEDIKAWKTTYQERYSREYYKICFGSHD